MKRSTLARAALPATLALGLALSGCSAANEPSPDGDTSSSDGSESGTSLSGTLNGAGASTQQAAFQAWQAGFNEANPDVMVNYDPAGSGAGREQFLSGAVPFAGSDAYLDEDELTQAQERCNGGTALDLPIYVSPIAVAYNLPGVDELTLAPATLARIFNQQITDWSDPAIAADNGGTALPPGQITVVNRADDSGTTENFIDYLVAAAPEDFPYEVSDTWPVPGGEAAQQTAGVVQAITAGEGSIGYADESQVAATELGTAMVLVGGEAVGPTAEAAAAIVDVSEPAPDRPEGDLAIDLARDTTEAGTYPIVLVSYQIACTTYESQEEADLVKAFITYTSSEEGQQAAADIAGSSPISAERRDAIAASLEMITAG